jgi:ATP synthase protein I
MLRTAGRVGAVGLEMGLAVAIGYFVGAWLDGRFGTTPVLGLVGLLLGVAAAGKALWSTARKLSKDQTPEEPE